MDNWIATYELRFVMREQFHGITKILQQKWLCVPSEEYIYEWRDVPVVEEE